MRDFNQEGSAHLKGTQTALKIPSGGDSSLPSKFGPGSKTKGAAARNMRRRSSGSLFAESFSPKPLYGSRPTPQPGNCNIPKLQTPSGRHPAKLIKNQFHRNQYPPVSAALGRPRNQRAWRRRSA